jgi:hypothetical protein
MSLENKIDLNNYKDHCPMKDHKLYLYKTITEPIYKTVIHWYKCSNCSIMGIF